jgi:hypothetical protein
MISYKGDFYTGRKKKLSILVWADYNFFYFARRVES